MSTPTATDLLTALNWRYATKSFDPTRKLPPETVEALLDALVLTPSSFGLQPWKFLVVDDPALRARLRIESWDQTQVTDASHLVVFTVRDTVTEADVDELLARVMAVRGMAAQALAPLRGMILGFIGGRSEADLFTWNSRQAYIALGQLMTCAALLGVDACPMEGFDGKVLDDELFRVFGEWGSERHRNR